MSNEESKKLGQIFDTLQTSNIVKTRFILTPSPENAKRLAKAGIIDIMFGKVKDGTEVGSSIMQLILSYEDNGDKICPTDIPYDGSGRPVIALVTDNMRFRSYIDDSYTAEIDGIEKVLNALREDYKTSETDRTQWERLTASIKYFEKRLDGAQSAQSLSKFLTITTCMMGGSFAGGVAGTKVGALYYGVGAIVGMPVGVTVGAIGGLWSGIKLAANTEAPRLEQPHPLRWEERRYNS